MRDASCEVAHHWLQSDANEEHALRASLLAARASTRAYAQPGGGAAVRERGQAVGPGCPMPRSSSAPTSSH